ncbi:OmpP1/FadL family transporter [Sulfuriferula sp.]|uniref:OmpP1/FadL family transporter n=1 Tax=Sulfuriferula sp. TaxID=2025307 RepID=UPI00272F134E|nr:outer membrane protein transport protein [Sulfuriferula sp.]MDP2026002.1 outer membrane protein transport protein [Sulfuriferula sp.]
MKTLIPKILAVSIAAASAVPLAANATNGYFLPGYGAAAMGMGGVGVAFAQDSLAAAANPAGIADVGMRADLGFGIFNPVRSAAVGSASSSGQTSGFGFNGGADSSNRYYMMPSAGYVMPWSEKLTFGIALVGNGGMNTTYKPNFFNGSEKLGIDLMQMLVPITAAYKTDEHNAFGASLVLGAQRFSARGLQKFGDFGISSDKAHLTNNGHDFAQGAGVRVGWRGKFIDDRLTLGATYASKVYMSRFSKYKGLFAEAGSFDVPANYALGIAVKATPKMTVAFDLERILYADVASVHNRGPGSPSGTTGIPAFFDQSTKLGLDNGMGFGWTNQTVYKLGVAYQYNSHWVLRAGYNYGKSPIPDDQLTFNTLAPATVEKHYTVGFTYSPDKNTEMTLAYLRAASNTQSNRNQNIVGGVDIQMYQNDLEFAYSWKF